MLIMELQKIEKKIIKNNNNTKRIIQNICRIPMIIGMDNKNKRKKDGNSIYRLKANVDDKIIEFIYITFTNKKSCLH